MRLFRPKHQFGRTARLTSGGVLASILAVGMLGVCSSSNAQLVITPTFDSTVTGASNAAAIQGAINSAIADYQSKFTNPINVTIKFQEMSTGLGSSNTTLYKLSYSTFINALVANQTSADDATALAHLPTGTTNPVTGSTTINVKTANIRALGIAGSFPPIGGFDGFIGLNTGLTDVGNIGTTGQYSLFAVVEHEIDEVLGLGSDIDGFGNSFFNDPAPLDLFRYSNTGVRNFTTAGDNAYFSIDGTTDIVQFNQRQTPGFGAGDFGDWHPNGSVPRVQDAFATPGAHPVLGPAETKALDVIGYNLAQAPTATPEFGSVVSLGGLLLAGSAGIWIQRRRRSA